MNTKISFSGFIIFILCSAASVKQKAFFINGFTQGTTYSITYYAKAEILSKEDVDKVFSEIDNSLSIYKSGSLISEFNNASRGIIMDKHLKEVVKYSLKVSENTNGAFDITVYPLVDAWGFLQQKREALPDSAQIKQLLNDVGYQKLLIKRDSLIKLNPSIKIDVNGIAQGYSIDVIAKYLECKHIKNYIVEVGGELKVKGTKPDGTRMKIGIETPVYNEYQQPAMSKIITLRNRAITTSGSYRKYKESNGAKISHLIDPKTGYSIKSKNISVTVLAKKAIIADSYDNVLMGMEIEEAFQFLKKFKDIEAYFIYEQNGVVKDTATLGFGKLFYIE